MTPKKRCKEKQKHKKKPEKKALVINSGSSSVKFELIEVQNEQTQISGICDAIGQRHSLLKYTINNKSTIIKTKIINHEQALKLILDTLKQNRIIKDLNELYAIGHRAVHGGEIFKNPTIVNKKLITEMEKLCSLAPLHNPANLTGIKVLKKIAPKIKQVAVFDTAFHSSIPDYAYTYAIPYEYYEKDKIRRYGFHGTSHNFVAIQASKILKKKITRTKLISCHQLRHAHNQAKSPKRQ